MSSFKTCPKCRHEWKTREEFLDDPEVSIIGFMANNEDSKKGAYLFNHSPPDGRCNSTLAVYVSHFMDLYDGPFYEELKAGSEECSGHCARIEVLEKCNAHCRNAMAREIIYRISDMLSANRNKKSMA